METTNNNAQEDNENASLAADIVLAVSNHHSAESSPAAAAPSSSTTILDSLDQYFGKETNEPEEAVVVNQKPPTDISVDDDAAAAASLAKDPAPEEAAIETQKTPTDISVDAAAASLVAKDPATASEGATTKRKALFAEEDSGSEQAKKRNKRYTWDERYEQLKAFKRHFGHTRVPGKGDWSQLQQWLYNNKRCKNGPYHSRPQLTREQIEKLDEIGIDWSLLQLMSSRAACPGVASWNERFEQLKAFKKEYGHTRVPTSAEWENLYKWLYKQRRRRNGPWYGGSQLSQQQIDKLDELDINWCLNKTPSRRVQSVWLEKYECLKAFKKEHGHTRVPRAGAYSSLHHWLYKNKKCKNGPYKHKPQLTTEQIDKLDELGISWTFQQNPHPVKPAHQMEQPVVPKSLGGDDGNGT